MLPGAGGNSPSLEQIWVVLHSSHSEVPLQVHLRSLLPSLPSLPSSLLSILPPLLPSFHASNKLFIERLPSARHNHNEEDNKWLKILHIIYLPFSNAKRGHTKVKKRTGEPTESGVPWDWALKDELEWEEMDVPGGGSFAWGQELKRQRYGPEHRGDRWVDWGAGSETAGGKAGPGRDFMGRVRVYFILNAMNKKLHHAWWIKKEVLLELKSWGWPKM